MNRIARIRPMAAVRRFLRDASGAAAVEFAIVCALFLTLILGAIDFGRALWEWNSAAKATQFGVRAAVVTPIVARGLQTFDGIAAAGGNGIPVPLASMNPNPVVCTATGCNGYGPLDEAAFATVVSQIQRAFPRVAAENVVIEYRHIGLGFAGNPFGPDIVPSVTVRLQGLTLNLVAGGLIGLDSLTLPPFAATLTGEAHGT